MIAFILQTEPPPTMTIEGAVLLLLLGLLPFSGRIFGALTKALEAIASRMSLKTDEKVRELDAFKLLSSEMDRMRDERKEDHKRLQEAIDKADRADKRADEFELSLKLLQNQFANLTRELDAARGMIAAKDEQIANLEDRLGKMSSTLITLTAENSFLRTEVERLKSL